ncbi:hypothetical protein [Lichenicoccus sp.]|uniref:hypothetical protein n=1 Tax=Lichenicoccus sp. TaxID=2781899 RepID=UPI003D10F58C
MPISHHAFGHHGFGVHHAYGGGSWITHMVVSSVIHALIYGAIFRVLRHLSLGEVLLLVVIVIAVLYYGNRNRGQRRWPP